jgi:Fic family protein
MEQFIRWFNTSDQMFILGKAALTHLYFEMIHPFEDGNGRLGRALTEKLLSQKIGKPLLIAISRELEEHKKEYYAALQACNKTLQIQPWIEFFIQMVLQACEHSRKLLIFLIEKSQFFARFSSQINARQTKALLRMFEEGPNGFQGGMSAEKYIAITKTTRATATRDLSDLVQKGALLKTGSLRHTRYHLPHLKTT